MACEEGNIELAQSLIKDNNQDVIHIVDYRLRTPFFVSIENGKLDCANWLIEIGALEDISKKDTFHRTPFFAACESGHIDCAKFLIETGASNDIRNPDDVMRTPISVACARGNLPLLKWLTRICGTEDLRLINENGDTLLHIACMNFRRNITEWLLQSGLADYLQVENKRHETPLILALPDISLPLWLCEQGAAHNNNSGLLELYRIPAHEHNHLRRYFKRRIAKFAAIKTLLLQSCVTRLYSTSNWNYETTSSRPNKRAPHHLKLFHGFQSAIFKIIANYADIPIGKPLRRLRDIQAALLKNKRRRKS
jgi:hypothetical protein